MDGLMTVFYLVLTKLTKLQVKAVQSWRAAAWLNTFHIKTLIIK